MQTGRQKAPVTLSYADGSRPELWDVYDKNRNKTGRTHLRGEPMAEGDFHLVVLVLIVNESGEIILTKRHPQKHYPNLWECTGGSATAGETSLTAAKREVLEEIGVDLSDSKGRLIHSYLGGDTFYDVWLFFKNIELNRTLLQPSEVTAIKYVTKTEFRRMYEEGEIVPTLGFCSELLEKPEVLMEDADRKGPH